MIGAFLKRLRTYLATRWRLEIRNPWRASEGARPSDVTADRIVLGVFSVWLTFVPLAIWMAVGQMPGWLAGSVVAVHWVFAGFQLLTIGLPPLVVPFFLIWLLFPGNRRKAEQWKDPQEEWEEGYDELVEQVEKIKELGVCAEDCEIPPRSHYDFGEYFKRESSDRPAFRLTIRIAGVILIAALIMAGRPILAAVYAFPALGWLALEGFEWIMLRRQHG